MDGTEQSIKLIKQTDSYNEKYDNGNRLLSTVQIIKASDKKEVVIIIFEFI